MNAPNVILINCDDLGYGDLGCYGSTRNKTPHLDRLASQGLALDDFYMASSVCSPSRGAMMTGCYPPRIGFGDFDGSAVLFPGGAIGLHEAEQTLPQMLKDAGYATKMVGKWHCGDQPEFLPTERGFDDYYGLPYSNDMSRNPRRPNDPPLPLLRNQEVIEQQPDQRSLTSRYTEECVRFIREDRSDQPFFLYLAHMYVHVPLMVPEQFMRASDNGAYGGAVEHIDWTMGVLMHELEAQGLADNTIVIFTSDNGSRARDEGGSNAPCHGTKASLWEGGIRVPCIVRWPERIAAGQRSRSVVSSIDLLPTLAALCGGQLAGKAIDGVDVQALFDDAGATPRQDFFYYFKDELVAVRSGDWKLFLADGVTPVQDYGPALYNLAEDVGERTDRQADEPEVVARLQALAADMRQDLGCSREGVAGAGRRPHGRVDNPKPLTEYNPDHPYICAMYDTMDGDVWCG
jgi:arylsulfatase A-like enzyme